jgi:hypothetical protein
LSDVQQLLQLSPRNAGEFEQGGAALNKDTSLLAKAHGSLELADSPADASAADYYTLAQVPECHSVVQHNVDQ